jgi:hypothetical protein
MRNDLDAIIIALLRRFPVELSFFPVEPLPASRLTTLILRREWSPFTQEGTAVD